MVVSHDTRIFVIMSKNSPFISRCKGTHFSTMPQCLKDVILISIRRGCISTESQFIPLGDFAQVNEVPVPVAVLHDRHRPDKHHHIVGVSIAGLHGDDVRFPQSCQAAHPLDVPSGVVAIVRWCPPLDDLPHGEDVVLHVVGVQDAKHSPVAPLVFEEDAKRAVVPCLTLPELVTLPDVQGIVIPQSPRRLLSFSDVHDSYCYWIYVFLSSCSH